MGTFFTEIKGPYIYVEEDSCTARKHKPEAV